MFAVNRSICVVLNVDGDGGYNSFLQFQSSNRIQVNKFFQGFKSKNLVRLKRLIVQPIFINLFAQKNMFFLNIDTTTDFKVSIRLYDSNKCNDAVNCRPIQTNNDRLVERVSSYS